MLCRRAVPGFCAVVLIAGSLSWLDAQTIESVQPMASDAHPSFEVATIKQSDSTDQKHRFEIHGRRIVIENQTVNSMIRMSYGIHARQIVNAPSWTDSERFDVQGVPDVDGQPNMVQFHEIVRRLLEDRFGLKLHTEKREMARYTLTIAKGGPKMEATKGSPDALPDTRVTGNGTSRSMQMVNVSMADVARNLQRELDRPVVDETGLKGRYDFTVKWLRADAAPAADDPDSALPGIFTALQEEVGLKVEPSKGDVDVLVIEHVERPSSN
ncbi:MAG TPA: TIGR03435 family protein [Acidobacteriaceae bacterium]|nr:TIGR03435 family protein [Acidobacteriaceae bacterium]